MQFKQISLLIFSIQFALFEISSLMNTNIIFPVICGITLVELSYDIISKKVAEYTVSDF